MTDQIEQISEEKFRQSLECLLTNEAKEIARVRSVDVGINQNVRDVKKTIKLLSKDKWHRTRAAEIAEKAGFYRWAARLYLTAANPSPILAIRALKKKDIGKSRKLGHREFEKAMQGEYLDSAAEIAQELQDGDRISLVAAEQRKVNLNSINQYIKEAEKYSLTDTYREESAFESAIRESEKCGFEGLAMHFSRNLAKKLIQRGKLDDAWFYANKSKSEDLQERLKELRLARLREIKSKPKPDKGSHYEIDSEGLSKICRSKEEQLLLAQVLETHCRTYLRSGEIYLKAGDEENAKRVFTLGMEESERRGDFRGATQYAEKLGESEMVKVYQTIESVMRLKK